MPHDLGIKNEPSMSLADYGAYDVEHTAMTRAKHELNRSWCSFCWPPDSGQARQVWRRHSADAACERQEPARPQ
jgi:hypothetical protein